MWIIIGKCVKGEGMKENVEILELRVWGEEMGGIKRVDREKGLLVGWEEDGEMVKWLME